MLRTDELREDFCWFLAIFLKKFQGNQQYFPLVTCRLFAEICWFQYVSCFFPLCGVRWNTLDSFQRLCTPAMLMNCSTHFSYDELSSSFVSRLVGDCSCIH